MKKVRSLAMVIWPTFPVTEHVRAFGTAEQCRVIATKVVRENI